MANGLKARLEAELAAALIVPPADPGYGAARVGAGQRADLLGYHDQSLAHFKEALGANADDPVARYELGCQFLLRGDYEPGWPEYRFLYHTPDFVRKKAMSLPLWDGPRQTGEGIVLYSDLGYGDAIHFMRYAPEVRRYFRRVLFLATGDLLRLFSGSGYYDEFLLEGEYRVRYPGGIKTVGAECYVPLSSLPAHCWTTESVITKPTLCWTDPSEFEGFRSRLRTDSRPLVGLAWRGKSITPRDPVRSFTSRDLLPLTGVAGPRFVLLQWGANGDETADFERSGAINIGTEIAERGWDYAVTAAAIRNLDLVITCDSVIAHLAGSLGVKTWVLLPAASEWRWQLRRPDSPWYPTVRLFRQTAFGDWNPVVAEVATALGREEYRG